MTRIIIEVGCEPGAATCGNCSNIDLAVDKSSKDVRWYCQQFYVYLSNGNPSSRAHATPRCDACLAAEKAASEVKP
jgi:hypothetical protein